MQRAQKGECVYSSQVRHYHPVENQVKAGLAAAMAGSCTLPVDSPALPATFGLTGNERQRRVDSGRW